MDEALDGASDPRSLPPLPLRLLYPTTLQNRYPPHNSHQGRRGAVSGKSTQCSIAELAKELVARYNERLYLMPLLEKGKYWTWAMWPGPKPPLQKDIENAKGIFLAFLHSELTPEDAAEYFTRGGPKLKIEDMRAHMESFVEVYNGMINDGDINAKAKLSTQFIRNHATRVFTALSRASNFVTMEVVVGTYEWIDEYLSVKYELRTHRDDDLDSFIPELNIEDRIRSSSGECSE